MALAEEHIFSRLSGFAGITAIVSTGIYPIRIPDGQALPALTYLRVSSRRVESMLGGTTALCFARFQFDCWARKYSTAKALAEQVRLALQGYTGTVSGNTIFGVNFLNEVDLVDDDAQTFRTSADYLIHHNEDVPA